MFRVSSQPVWILLAAAAAAIFPGFLAGAGDQDEVCNRLRAGEVIVSFNEAGRGPLKRGEVMGVINAPPETVWRVITDFNNYRYFMPRTLNSMVVAADKLPQILQRKPDSPEAVEQMLGGAPADHAGSRLPGGKSISYLYSHLDFPWPCQNRWYIIKLEQDETRAAAQFYHLSWTLALGNLRENRGEWILEPFDATHTKVTYRLLTDPGGKIPKFLINQGTCSTLPQIIAAVKNRAEVLYGRK